MTDFSRDPDGDARQRLLDIARRCGAEDADVIAMRSRSLDVSVLGGKIEDASRSEEFGIGLRVFKGRSHAYGSTADISENGLTRLAEQVCAMASVTPEDTYTRLANSEELVKEIKDIELYDSSSEPDTDTLREMAVRLEESGVGVAGITKSDSASAGHSQNWIGLSTSRGFSGGYGSSSFYLSLSLIAGADDAMETDSASGYSCFKSDLEDPEVIGVRAAERTLGKLNSRNGKTGVYPILFDRRVSDSLLRSFSRMVSGPRLAKGTSLLCGKLGQKVFSSSVCVIDDPFKKRGLRSMPFDAEGLSGERRVFVEGGVLQHYFLDLRSAARLGEISTGHAVRGLASPPTPAPSNLWIEKGSQSRADLIGDMGEGFLVTELMGASISLTTGDYSRGASGFWIENGEIAYPVTEMTIAGNLGDMFMNMIPADDLEFRSGIDAPSLLVTGMTTASR